MSPVACFVILRCESGLCQSKRKKEECSNFKDCLSNIIANVSITIINTIVLIVMMKIFSGKKLCSANKACACVQRFCKTPWWAWSGRKTDSKTECRNDQVWDGDGDGDGDGDDSGGVHIKLI